MIRKGSNKRNICGKAIAQTANHTRPPSVSAICQDFFGKGYDTLDLIAEGKGEREAGLPVYPYELAPLWSLNDTLVKTWPLQQSMLCTSV